MLLQTEPSRGPTQPCPTPKVEEAVCVAVGFAGDVQGQVIVSMPLSVALEMVALLTLTACEVLDELAQSAIAEVGNIVAGACATDLAAQGIACDITVPSVIAGDPARVTLPGLDLHATPLEFTFGRMHVNVGLKQTAP